MSRTALTVNGNAVTADVAPRTHLADFLREELLLTGTHLGCEHGVCGACTVLIDGAPARSCIAFVVACGGADIRTIEGLEDDPVIARLRAAFTAEHALQCGYCTPGMLVTARDIVQRLPSADEARIRLELAGNLCRCTGYAGIVRAIRRVLGEALPAAAPVPASLPTLPVLPVQPAPGTTGAPSGPQIVQTLRIGAPIAAVWAAIRDPRLIADCMPGARLIDVAGDRLRGEVRASLGPIETLFSGEARSSFDDRDRRAEIVGDGRDGRTGTRLNARVAVRLQELDAASTELAVAIDYTLHGPLAQFARGGVAQELAAEITTAFAAGLEARLTGRQAPRQHRLPMAALIFRAMWRRLRAVLRLR